MPTFKGDPDYNSLTPQSVKGDLAVYGTGGATRVPIGADGSFFKANSATSTGVEWGSGSANLNVAFLSGATTLTSANDLVLVSGTTFAVTLPNVYANTGKVLRIKKTDSGWITPISVVGITGTQLVEGVAGLTLNTQYESYELVAGTSHWHLNEHYIDTTWYTGASLFAFGVGSTNTVFLQRRIGSGMQFRGYVQSTTSGGSPMAVYLPAGILPGSSLHPGSSLKMMCGQWMTFDNLRYTNQNIGPVLTDPVSSSMVFLSATSINGAGNPDTSNTAGAGFGVAFTFDFTIGIAGWKG